MLSVFKLVIGMLLFTAITAKSRESKPRERRPYWKVCMILKGYLLLHRNECSFKIPTYGCRGGCLSSAKPFSHRTGFASSCSCCAPILTSFRERVIQCGGKIKLIRYPVARKCACRPCLDGS